MKPEPPINPNYPSAARLPKWTPFVRAALPPMPGTTFYENSRYQVTLRQQQVIVMGLEVQAVRLGIANFDHSARHD